MLTVEFIDLFERQVLGLVDEKVHEDHSDEAEAAPDPENVTFQVDVLARCIFQIGSDESENKVEEPIGGGGQRHALSADLEGEHLSGDDPSS